MTDEQTRPPLAKGNWDGMSKAEHLHRVLTLAQYRPTPPPRPTLIARLKASWAAWVAFWRRHR